MKTIEVHNGLANLDLAKQAQALIGLAFDTNLTEPILGQTDEIKVADNLSDMLTAVDTTSVLLVEDSHLVGANVIIPISVMNPQRLAEDNETAYVYYTVIEEPERGKGLIRFLNNRTVSLLGNRAIKFMELDAQTRSGYADIVERNYGKAIVDWREHDDWDYGVQRFFRIDLSRVAETNA